MSIRKRVWTTGKGVEREAWIVDYTDQAGKRHLKTFKRKKEADAFAATAWVEVRRGTHTAEGDSISVEEAGKLWIATGERNGLERASMDAYRQHLDLHIVPYLGRLKLSQLSAPGIREFEDRLRKDERSPAMTKKILGSLGSILADAQERGKVARNVVRDLRSRRHRGRERQAKRRQSGKLKVGVDIPTPREIRAIVGALDGRWRPLLLTAIFTGLRASELRGLRWCDIDFEERELHVRQRADRYNETGSPKSEAGERTVPITPIVLSILREWKLACPKGSRELVFPSGAGNVESHANIINRGLIPAQIKAGVVAGSKPRAKYTGLHALRHFYASWCINRQKDGGLGLLPKVVQERMGHSSIVMTMDTYGHLFPRGDDSAELAAAERSLIA